jgi:DNA polymerase-1
MEVWIFAFKAKDPVLTSALLNGEDIHDSTAKYIWGDKSDFEFNRKLYRKKGKTLQFLKQYGGTAKAAAELLDCSRLDAQIIIDEYDERLPGVREFIERLSLEIEKTGELRNAFGRKYLIDSRFSYKGVNYYVQGTCADMLKRAYIRLDSLCLSLKTQQNKKSRVLMPVHDEFIIEVPKSLDSLKLRKSIIKIMQMDSKIVGLPKEIPVKLKTSTTTWSEAKEGLFACTGLS